MLIIGWIKIAEYCGVSVASVRRWHRFHGFPAAPLPSRRIATTESLINQWILARNKLAHANKPAGYHDTYTTSGRKPGHGNPDKLQAHRSARAQNTL